MDNATAVVVVAAITSVPAMLTAFNTRKVRHVEKVATAIHEEVKTLNGKTVGVLIDESEQRRVAALPPEDRTAEEQHHLDVTADLLPEVGDTGHEIPVDRTADPDRPE